MIRLATKDDLNKISEIVNKVIPIMQNEGNDQWNESYPKKEHFLSDIKDKNLYVIDEDKTIKAVMCINQEQPKEYEGIKWTFDKQAIVIHRAAVEPKYHGEGLAFRLFKFAEEKAIELGIDYIRSDTCIKNVKMNKIFSKFGYSLRGKMSLPGFIYNYNCYEKLLVEN